MIYQFDDSINFLKSTLETRIQSNPSYSMRAFATKLGLSAGGLSLVLNRKKKLSVERSHEVAVALSLDVKETEYFMALVQLEGAKSPTLRIQMLEKIKALNPNISNIKDFKKNLLSLEHFKLISDWYGLAILELITGVKGEWDSVSIAKKLDLTKIEVELMLERLLKLELIQETEAGYRRSSDTLLIESQVPNEALKKYYEGVLEKASKSVRSQTPKTRVTGGQVFAFDMDQMEEVRKLTNDYLDNLNDLAKTGKNKTEIYQAIVNVFKLSQENV